MFFQHRKLTESEQKWNRMWELWAEGKASFPYAQMMAYESEVNNGGHSQYFCNTANCGDLKQDVEILLTALPGPLRENLKQCYDAFTAGTDSEALCEQCDGLFYREESLLIALLEAYAQSMTL